jgi:hypothetical protein
MVKNYIVVLSVCSAEEPIGFVGRQALCGWLVGGKFKQPCKQ